MGKNKLVVLAYHSLRSVFDNSDNRAREMYYALNLFPTVVFNGTIRSSGGSTIPNDPNVDQGLELLYNQAKRSSSPLQIALTGMIVMEDPSRYRADCHAVITATARHGAQKPIVRMFRLKPRTCVRRNLNARGVTVPWRFKDHAFLSTRPGRAPV